MTLRVKIAKTHERKPKCPAKCRLNIPVTKGCKIEMMHEYNKSCLIEDLDSDNEDITSDEEEKRNLTHKGYGSL